MRAERGAGLWLWQTVTRNNFIVMFLRQNNSHRPMTYLVSGSWTLSCVRLGFNLTERAVKPIRKWLVTVATFVPPLHPYVF